MSPREKNAGYEHVEVADWRELECNDPQIQRRCDAARDKRPTEGRAPSSPVLGEPILIDAAAGRRGYDGEQPRGDGAKRESERDGGERELAGEAIGCWEDEPVKDHAGEEPAVGLKPALCHPRQERLQQKALPPMQRLRGTVTSTPARRMEIARQP
eukprot:1209515-Rhodomonas_salina.1